MGRKPLNPDLGDVGYGICRRKHSKPEPSVHGNLCDLQISAIWFDRLPNYLPPQVIRQYNPTIESRKEQVSKLLLPDAVGGDGGIPKDKKNG